MANPDSFDKAKEIITEIRTAFGAPSISCGILHNGKIIFLHGDGLADVEKGLVPDGDTVYAVASCTKAFTAALCGILVDEGKLAWTEPVKAYRPDFETVHDPEVSKRATLLDMLSHGTGLNPLDHAFLGFYDEFWTSLKDQVKVAGNLPVCYDFRTQWLYNNTMIGVAGDVIATVMDQPWAKVLQERILGPLGMTRSFTGANDYPADGNVARGYSVLDDDSLLPLAQSALSTGDFHESAGSLKSSVRDMLTWARAVMEAEVYEANQSEGAKDVNSNPLRQMTMIRSVHRPVTLDGGHENSYGLCWLRHMLPTSGLGPISANRPLLSDFPVINKDGPPRLAISHSGEFNGFLTAFYTFPETCSAVIAIANCSPGRGDPSDLAAQALIQELFQMAPRIDFPAYAASAARNAKDVWPAFVKEFEANRHPNTNPGPLEDYIGTYVNEDFCMTIDVYPLPDHDREHDRADPELLGFTVNKLERQSAKLSHYHYDTWTFAPHSRDDALRKGMESFMSLPLILLSFIRNDQGISSLAWDLQGGAMSSPAPYSAKNANPVIFQRRKP